MKVILMTDVPALGHRGETRDVANGYARNFLLPRKLAVLATPANLKNVEHLKRHRAKEEHRALEAAKATAARIEALTVAQTARASEDGHLYGSVSAQDVVEYLERNQVPVEKRRCSSTSHQGGRHRRSGPSRRDGVADGLGRRRVTARARVAAMATTSAPGKVRRRASRRSAVLGASCSEPRRAPSSSSSRRVHKNPPEDLRGDDPPFERGEAPDTIMVAETLRRDGVFEEVGGHTVLATLQEEGTVATQFAAYTAIVREKALLREMIRVAREIVEEGYEENDDVQGLLDRAEQMLFRISQRRFQRSAFPVREILDAAIKHIEMLYHRKEDITGLATGFNDLDKMTSGLQGSDFVIIAGRPSTGKTAFALNIAAHAAVELHRPALIFSLEMSGQLVQRLICAGPRRLPEGALGTLSPRGQGDHRRRWPASEAPCSSTTTATSPSWRRAPRPGGSRRSTARGWWSSTTSS
jgi:ribosomal protein L9